MFVELTIQNKSVENVLKFIETYVQSKNYSHYAAIIYRRNYLGISINIKLMLSNSIEDTNKLIKFYDEEYFDYYSCSALFRDGVLLNENNGYILFSKTCNKCSHCICNKTSNESLCEVFNCSPQYVTYICFNYNKKGDK